MPWSDMLTCPSKISSILYPYSKFEFRNITQSHKHNYKNPIRNPQVFFIKKADMIVVLLLDQTTLLFQSLAVFLPAHIPF